ncbi:MAG: hypothetical protein WCP55_08440 [Lentisphaerota bacterium]
MDFAILINSRRDDTGILQGGYEWKKNGRWKNKYYLQFNGQDNYVGIPGPMTT